MVQHTLQNNIIAFQTIVLRVYNKQTNQVEERKMGLLFVFIVRSLSDKEFTTHSALYDLVVMVSCCMSPHGISSIDFLVASITRVNFSRCSLSRIILYYWFYRASLYSSNLVYLGASCNLNESNV